MGAGDRAGPHRAGSGLLPVRAPDDAGQPSTCWYADENIAAITARVQADTSIPDAEKQGAINAERIRGLGGIALLLMGLFAAGSVLTGLSFYTMARTGQHVLLQIRKQLFRHLHAALARLLR